MSVPPQKECRALPPPVVNIQLCSLTFSFALGENGAFPPVPHNLPGVLHAGGAVASAPVPTLPLPQGGGFENLNPSHRQAATVPAGPSWLWDPGHISVASLLGCHGVCTRPWATISDGPAPSDPCSSRCQAAFPLSLSPSPSSPGPLVPEDPCSRGSRLHSSDLGNSCLIPVRPGQDTHLQYGHESTAAPRLCVPPALGALVHVPPAPRERPCTPHPQRNRLQAPQVRNQCREVNGPGTPSSAAAAAAARVRTQNPAGQSCAEPTEHTHGRGLSALSSAQRSCTVGQEVSASGSHSTLTFLPDSTARPRAGQLLMHLTGCSGVGETTRQLPGWEGA